MAKGKITIAGITALIGALLILYFRVYVASEVAEVVIENPEPFIDAVKTMCKVDEMFTNAIDSPLLNNVPEDTKEILLLMRSGAEIDVCQAKILEEGLSASQKHKINFKKLGCNIADCLN